MIKKPYTLVCATWGYKPFTQGRIQVPNPANKGYPYLLKGLKINHPDHVWSIDITYIPVQKSWLYLTAIIDWYSRYIISWEIDDTLEIPFVLEACKNALNGIRPEIMISDQGSHFTSSKYTGLFLEAGAKISMDHRGRAYDNIFIERFWRSLKYENVYPQDYSYPREARNGINQYIAYVPHLTIISRKFVLTNWVTIPNEMT